MEADTIEFHIAIPFVGSEDYLLKTIDSVLVQTCKSWKLTVIGDGISDIDIKRISMKYEDYRIHFLSYSEKQGIGRMFNHCLEILDSRWNMILGADDLLSPEFLENLIEGLEKYPGAEIIQPQTKIINSAGKQVKTIEDSVKSIVRFRYKSHLFTSRNAIYSLAIGNWLYFPSIVWSERAIQARNFDLEFEIALDLDFVLKILGDGGRVLYWPRSQFLYRRHLESASMKPDRYFRRATEETQIYDQLAKLLWEKGQHFGALLARLRITSRLNLLLKLPKSSGNQRRPLVKLFLKF